MNNRLKEIRQQEGVSQSAFATLFGLKQQTYQKYESGIASIPDDLKAQLAERYGINLHWLITGEGPMHVGETEGEAGHARARMDDIERDALKDSVVVAMTGLMFSGFKHRGVVREEFSV